MFRPVVDEIPGLSLDMVVLRGGRFFMEAAGCDVEVGRFTIQKYPVTRALYRAVMDEDPSSRGAEQAPVNEVSWYAAVEFCNRLSARASRAPCYRVDGEQVTWIPEADGYRLATEAEWEFAIRAGTETEYFFGSAEQAEQYAWFDRLSTEPQPVGQKLPNAWGLHDMAGNVWEWCWDTYHVDKVADYMTNVMTIVSAPGGRRVLRGGRVFQLRGVPAFGVPEQARARGREQVLRLPLCSRSSPPAKDCPLILDIYTVSEDVGLSTNGRWDVRQILLGGGTILARTG